MSVTLLQLWLPIVLGGLFCWIASAFIHIVIKYHNYDYTKLSNEDDVSQALGQSKPKPGLYHLPYCVDMKEMQDPAMQKKLINGPIAMISVFESGLPKMGKLMIQQILFFIVACLFIAYVATLSLTVGSDTMSIIRILMVVSFLTLGYGIIPHSIWLGLPWSNCLRYLIDALIYAAIIALTFAWL
ncbi:MAG: hypothetical protein AB8B80_09220 [Marinicellaceae bacterium]